MKKYAPRKVFILENGEYVELTYEEFESRKANDPTYEDRYFIPVQGFLMEVSKEHYQEFYRAKEREAYLRKLNAKYGLLEDYNEFVEQYNKVYSGKYDGSSTVLYPITDDILPQDTLGKPENYFNTLHGGVCLSKELYSLSHSGGTTGSEFVAGFEETESFSAGGGISFEVSKTVGVGFVFGGGSAGWNFGFELGGSDGDSETQINETGTSGTVANIDKNAWVADGVERATIESFNFNWQLAMWEHVLQKTADKDQKVPVIGYVITNVTRPNSCPDDVYAAVKDDQVKISWSPIKQEDLVNNDLLVGYKVFRSIDGGDKELIAHLKVTTQPDGKQTLETLYTDNTTQIDDGKICSYTEAHRI